MTNAGLKWVKSRFSEAGTHPRCVEVAEDGEQRVGTPRTNYALFVAGVIAGDLDYIEPVAGVTA